MKQILTRLALTVPGGLAGGFAGFLLIHLVPGDPILQMLGEGATPADMDALRHQYGLDQPSAHAVSPLLGRRAARRPGQFDSSA